MNLKKIRDMTTLKPSTKKKVLTIVRTMWDSGYTEQIPTKMLRVIIMRVAGHDPRTVRLYIELLVQEGYLARVSPHTYQVLDPDATSLDDFNVGSVEVKLEKKE